MSVQIFQNRWEIIDEKGVIFSGSEDEMKDKFEKLINLPDPDDGYEWEGDIKLVEVHNTYR